MSHSNKRARSIITGALLLLVASAGNSQIPPGFAIADGQGGVAFNLGSIRGAASSPGNIISGGPGPIFVHVGAGGSDTSIVYQPDYPSGPEYPNLVFDTPCCFVLFTGTVNVTHAGTFQAPFEAEGEFACNPCADGSLDFLFEGSGTFTSRWVGSPSLSFTETGAICRFGGVPEPSTASLLLIGFAGLAVLGRRRRPLKFAVHRLQA